MYKRQVYGASGEELVAGVSCASPLPFGPVLEVEGVGTYIVQDRTASWVVDKYGENLVDIYFDDHQAALEFGLQSVSYTHLVTILLLVQCSAVYNVHRFEQPLLTFQQL